MNTDGYPCVIIAGPTASGKSALSMVLAEAFDGEIVNYDSIQVFRGFDIGSAKPTAFERQQRPHHLIDIRNPDELFTAGDYQREARRVLDDLRRRRKLPVLVGGTGLYVRALVEGLFDGPRRVDELRNRLAERLRVRGPEHLHRILRRLDPPTADRIAPRDAPKVVRAIEVRLATGKTLSAHLERLPRQPLTGFRPIWIGLNPPRPELYARINARVIRMFEEGLLDEVRRLVARYPGGLPKPLEAIGYRHVAGYLSAGGELEQLIAAVQQDTRRYAKRQLTWFRKQTGLRWFDGPGDDRSIQQGVREYLLPLVPGRD